MRGMSSTAQINALGRIAGSLEDLTRRVEQLVEAAHADKQPPPTCDRSPKVSRESVTEHLAAAVMIAQDRLRMSEDNWLSLCRAFWWDIAGHPPGKEPPPVEPIEPAHVRRSS